MYVDHIIDMIIKIAHSYAQESETQSHAIYQRFDVLQHQSGIRASVSDDGLFRLSQEHFFRRCALRGKEVVH